ncbi:helix-turn-helix domain-containing protein [Mucilaginibacter ginsenosidivorans]|uniref:Helix-turn-helix transcriptional regulator n=1 Tax=Mucilaginibacter ginsenosidivorans TaxID=398053 RepID=A0A5B8UTM8_9SPHI|nr:helix-turn-helix transcriptional regulator [Mucilaginibacter ginsenosidivorans]QEC61751.1 helix-turn-helix transcriptional regulator [Mucilaginibacter ginsenosidivorans]
MIKGGTNRRNDVAIQTVARNMRKYRLQKNLTMTALANIIGVDYSQISRMERGKVNANISIIFDIAAVLEISPMLLVEQEHP